MALVSRIAVAVGLATLATALGACGSNAPSLSRGQLVSKANSICTSAQRAATEVPSPTNLSDATVAAAYFDKIAPITDKETSDLAALKPDSSARADWNAFVSAQKNANSLLQAIRHKADAKNTIGLQDLSPVPQAGNQVRATASKLGAAACAQ